MPFNFPAREPISLETLRRALGDAHQHCMDASERCSEAESEFEQARREYLRVSELIWKMTGKHLTPHSSDEAWKR